MPTVNKLKESGVGSILDYAAEADIDEENSAADSEFSGASHSEHIEERECEKNVRIFLECIEAAGQFEDGFAAIKVTALGRPILLEKMTLIINRTMELFQKFDSDSSGMITYEQFKEGLHFLGVEMSEEEMKDFFSDFDKDGSGEIDFIEWLDYLKIEDLRYKPMFTSSASSMLPTLNKEECLMLENLMRRLYVIADFADMKGVKLMVDAEHTYFQGAIDHAVLNLMRKYNQREQIIFNTYQAYLKNTHYKLMMHLEKSRREGFLFSCKLVRGAYMNLERARAKEMGYPSPICDTLDDTHANYHTCLDTLFDNIDRSKVMLASHNQNTVEYATQKMKDMNIANDEKKVYFGQLLGMADNISFTLGQAGYNCYKYVPYGPLNEVIPYLVRRAEENSNILGGTVKERGMLAQEFRRRLFMWK